MLNLQRYLVCWRSRQFGTSAEVSVRQFGTCADLSGHFGTNLMVRVARSAQRKKRTFRQGIFKGASVRAAAAGIIAADFTAVSTDSSLPVGVAQRLLAASQRC